MNLLLLVACLHRTRPPADTEPLFFCEGPPQAPEPAPEPVLLLPPGELLVEHIAGRRPRWIEGAHAAAAAYKPPPPAPSPEEAPREELLISTSGEYVAPGERPAAWGRAGAAEQWVWAQAAAIEVRVHADAIRLSTLAVALSKETGLPIRVERGIADKQVFLAAEQASLASVLTMIEHHGVRGTFRGDALHLTQAPRLGPTYCPAPHQTLVLPIDEGLLVPPEHLAELYCRSWASSTGWIAVVGETLVIKDSGDRLAMFREIVQQYQPPED